MRQHGTRAKYLFDQCRCELCTWANRQYQADRRQRMRPTEERFTTRIFTPRPDWFDHAACRGTDPNLFHPGKHDMSTAFNAKRVCRGCVVRQSCLDWALEQEEPEGIWGGCSPTERRVILRARREAA